MIAPNILEDNFDLDLNVPELRRLYRRLLRAGYTPGESANLCAKLIGMGEIRHKDWTMKQLEHLLFLRATDNKSDDRP